jgi:hypothetical protein
MAESSSLLIKFVINNLITKYISTSAASLSRLYTPQIIAPPSFEVGGDGYLAAGFGSFSVLNNPHDQESVFNFHEGTYPPENKSYTISIEWGEQDVDLFTGSAVVRSITDESIELDILGPEYSQDLLEFTLNTTKVPVTNISAGNDSRLRITANNHGIEAGADVIFEEISRDSSLNYDGTSSKVYTCVAVDVNNFELKGTNSSDFSLGSESTGSTGIPVLRPRSFGEVTHRLPVEKSSTTLSNPYLDSTKIIRVYEDGVNIGAGKSTSSSISITSTSTGSTTTYTVASHDFIVGDNLTPSGFTDTDFHVAQTVLSITATSITTNYDSSADTTAGTPSIDFTNVFSTAPTNSKITLNNTLIGGEVSITGTSVHGTSLNDTMSYLSGALSLTLDNSKASEAASLEVSTFIDRQIKVIDFADELCAALNYNFYISDSKIYLIDKANSSTAIDLLPANIIDIGFGFPFPVKQLVSNWAARVPFTGTDKRLGSQENNQFANNNSLLVGNTKTIPVFVESEILQKSILQSLMDIQNKPSISVTKSTIDIDCRPGDRLVFNDEDKEVSFELIVREISFDFRREQTTFSGDGKASAIKRN